MRKKKLSRIARRELLAALKGPLSPGRRARQKQDPGRVRLPDRLQPQLRDPAIGVVIERRNCSAGPILATNLRRGRQRIAHRPLGGVRPHLLKAPASDIAEPDRCPHSATDTCGWTQTQATSSWQSARRRSIGCSNQSARPPAAADEIPAAAIATIRQSPSGPLPIGMAPIPATLRSTWWPTAAAIWPDRSSRPWR